MPIGERSAVLTRRSKGIQELRRERSHHAVSIVAKVVHVDGKAAVVVQANDVAHLIEIGIGTARCERHHRAFLKGIKTQVLRDQRVDHADAVKEMPMPAPLEAVAFSGERTGCRVISVAVHNQNGRLFER